jgi:hypothetical protein
MKGGLGSSTPITIYYLEEELLQMVRSLLNALKGGFRPVVLLAVDPQHGNRTDDL